MAEAALLEAVRALRVADPNLRTCSASKKLNARGSFFLNHVCSVWALYDLLVVVQLLLPLLY